MKKVKVFIAMIAVALGGLIIWSCTQDEMENGQGTYRYSAEEIVTLRAMAEKYGVPEVVFETESGIPLPTLEEMEETFKSFINGSVGSNRLNLPLNGLQNKKNPIQTIIFHIRKHEDRTRNHIWNFNMEHILATKCL